MEAAGDAAHFADLLAPLGPVAVRRMFGGAGLFLDGAMVALVAGGILYLKADDDLARDLAAAGSEPFSYDRRGRVVSLGYWRMPESAFDDPEEALAWAARALVPAREAAARKAARKGRAARA